MDMRTFFNTRPSTLAIVVGSLFTCAVNGAKYILARTGKDMYALINLETGDCRKNSVEIPHFADGIDEDDFRALIGKKTDLDDWHLIDPAATRVAVQEPDPETAAPKATEEISTEALAKPNGHAVPPILVFQLVLP